MHELDAYLKKEGENKTYLDEEPKKSNAPMLRNLWLAKIDDVVKKKQQPWPLKNNSASTKAREVLWQENSNHPKKPAALQ